MSSVLNTINIPQGSIVMGQGEYLVFHDKTDKQPSPKVFELAYNILLQHKNETMNSGSGQNYADRYEQLKVKLKAVDETLYPVFIPRTLYELIFVQKCIEEEIGYSCPGLEDNKSMIMHKDDPEGAWYLERRNERLTQGNCWHLAIFTDAGNDHDEGVKNVAFRLNKVMIDMFNPSIQGFSYSELTALTEKQIEFLIQHYENFKPDVSSICVGPAIFFGSFTTKLLGIRGEEDASILRKAVELECSTIAHHSLLLYRGSDLNKDSIQSAHSLSYGTSVFAGCVYDFTATAYFFMRNGENANFGICEISTPHAIPIPFDQHGSSPFYVPRSHTVSQLFGFGETFHPRTMVAKGTSKKNIKGIRIGEGSDDRDHLVSNQSEEQLMKEFQRYKTMSIPLNISS